VTVDTQTLAPVIPEKLIVDAHPNCPVGLAQPVLPFAPKGNVGELGPFDNDLVGLRGDQRGGFEVGDVELVAVGPADGGDLRGRPLVVVGVGHQATYLTACLPAHKRPPVTASAPYEGNPRRRESNFPEAPRVSSYASLKVLLPGSATRTVVSLLCYC
jgi:hypothetical protein